MDMLNLNKIEDELINNESFNIDEWYGFIYLVKDTISGKMYIGKKNFKTNRNIKLGKKEIKALPITRGRKASKKQVIAESDWKTYYGSADEIKNNPDKSHYERYLLKLARSSKELTYFELKYLCVYEVLEKPDLFINSNILGKIFTKDLSQNL